MFIYARRLKLAHGRDGVCEILADATAHFAPVTWKNLGFIRRAFAVQSSLSRRPFGVR